MALSDFFKSKWSTGDVADTIMNHHESLCQTVFRELLNATKNTTAINADEKTLSALALEAYCAHLAVWFFFFETAFLNEAQLLRFLRQIVDGHRQRSLTLDDSVDFPALIARAVSHLEINEHQARLTLYLNVCDNGCGVLSNLGLEMPHYIQRKMQVCTDSPFSSNSPQYPISHLALVAYHRCFHQMLRADTDANWQIIDNAVYAYWFEWWITLARLYQKARSDLAFRP